MRHNFLIYLILPKSTMSENNNFTYIKMMEIKYY